MTAVTAVSQRKSIENSCLDDGGNKKRYASETKATAVTAVTSKKLNEFNELTRTAVNPKNDEKSTT